MKLKLFAIALCLTWSAPHVQAQDTPTQSAEPEDQVVAIGTRRQDPAMSAYLAGDYETAEIEFERNAFCALRAERNFRSGVEAARDSTIRSENFAATDTVPQPTGGQGGANVQTLPSVAPTISLNSSDFEKNESTTKRTCADRGFQYYMAGLSQIKLGKFEDAKASLYRATALRKSIYDAHFRLALLEYQDGNIKKSRAQLKRLQRLQAKCRKCEFEKEIDQQVAYLDQTLN